MKNNRPQTSITLDPLIFDILKKISSRENCSVGEVIEGTLIMSLLQHYGHHMTQPEHINFKSLKDVYKATKSLEGERAKPWSLLNIDIETEEKVIKENSYRMSEVIGG